MTKIKKYAIQLDDDLIDAIRSLCKKTGKTQINILRELILPLEIESKKYKSFTYLISTNSNGLIEIKYMGV